MRIVLDTNVLVSALHFRGVVRDVLVHIVESGDTLVVSPFLLDELDRVLREKFLWDKNRRRELQAWFARNAEIVEAASVPDVISSDPADNHVLACAEAGKADVIVSGDTRHLLPLKRWRSIPIFSPAEFLEQYS